jgi:hypothetical protein
VVSQPRPPPACRRFQRASPEHPVLQEYSNCHREQRGFILGNGPSLRHTDLSLLQDESLLPTVPRDRVLINY